MKSTPTLLSLLCAILITGMLNAQDIGISKMVYPEDGQRVHLMFTYEIEFTVVNYGSSTVSFKDMQFDLLYDKQKWQTYNGPSTGTLAPGDSADITIPALTIATANPTIELCIASRIPGDMDPSNDTVCNILPFSLDNFIDFGPILIRITDPLVNDSLILTETPVIRMEGYIKNFGTVTLPRNYSVLVNYKMYSKSRNFFGQTNTSLDTGGLFTLTMVGGHPNVQKSPGPFQVCITIINLDDQNESNDEYCQTFYAFNYDGIDDFESNEINSYAYGDQLNIQRSGEAEVLNIKIYNESGQLLLERKSRNGEGSEYIDLGDLSPGMYLINILDEKGRMVHRNKFVLD